MIENSETTAETMANNDNLKGNTFADKPERINTDGRPKGSQNRSTIARKVLAMEVPIPKDLKEHFAEMYPGLPKMITVEMLATLSVMRRAINDGEYLHYKAIVDSAYGAPIQEIDMTSDGERINPVVTVLNSTAPLSSSEKDVKID